MKTMTMRERILAVVKGEPHDRIPFVKYASVLPTQEVWDHLGQEHVGVLCWAQAQRIAYPNCRFETIPLEKDGLRGGRTTLITPKGSLQKTYFLDPTYGTAATHEFFVKELADYDILDSFLEDAVVTCDPTIYERACESLGDNGHPMVQTQRTAWQQLWIEWVGAEDLAWHFADDEDRVMRTIGLMEKIQRQIFDCICQLKPPFVDFADNITAPMIGRANFERFCMPMYQELAGRLAEFGSIAFCHADGDLKPIWDLIGRSGLKGLDSYTPPPDNDTRVADAIEIWPQMRLFMNFPSSIHLKKPEEIRAAMREILAQGGNSGRLQVQISENVPLFAWRTSLPAIVEEIEAFGTPGCFR